MRVVDEEPMETLHLYVVPEDQLPPKRDYLAIFMVIFSTIILVCILAITLLAPSPEHEVAFSLAIQGYALAPVSRTIKVTAIATGKQYVPATTATGTITFYNGAIYPQIIPLDTVLTGGDGIRVVTDEQAVIPPAAQTTPPAYGQVSVSAHALITGKAGNIQAGDINEACCVTSVIAQNASFHGGRDAYTYTYLSGQDIEHTAVPLLPALQAQTLATLRNPKLNPTCTTVTTSIPGVGKKTVKAVLSITETCKALSYSVSSAKDSIYRYSRKHFGTGTLTHVQFSIVGVKNMVITLFVTAQWNPVIVRHVVVK
jgi:baseplate J-like protein